MARVQQHISEREYHASENHSGLQAPNRAHNLRTYFEKQGIRVHDRTAGGTPELVRLSLAGVGRGEALAAAAPGERVVTDENRVEIHRPGLVEWYVNSESGLEQGFTLEQRPIGEGPLVVELAVAGARTSLQGSRVVFESAQRKLAYGQLVAADAEVRTLPAHFELPSIERVRIVVDDSSATYPLVIDPLLTESPDTQLESDQAVALLGGSVAGAGDVNGDGYADVIVGAVLYDAGELNEGAAFIFLGSAAGLASGTPVTAATQLESNQGSEPLGLVFFGDSVAGAGDVNGDGYADVIVGAHMYEAGQSTEGVALVFHGSPSGVADGNPSTAAARLESNQIDARLGVQVAGAGDVNGDGYADVIVGAYRYAAGQGDEGAAFVFHGAPSGIGNRDPSTADARLESNQVSAQMGYRVASAGDVNGDGYSDVIVSSFLYDAGQTDEGAAFVFHGGPSGIGDGNPSTAAAQLESDLADAELGYSVAGAGDVNGDGYADAIVGARSYGAGAAFVFHGSATGIPDSTPATASARLDSDQAETLFGTAVAGAGDVNGDGYADAIVGAAFYEAGELEEGAAFLFHGGPSGIASGDPTSAAAQLESDQEGANLGIAVAGAGDVNGDGYADVIVGADSYASGESLEGAAFVFHGGASGIASGNLATAAAQFTAEALSTLTMRVAGAGDVNADGYDDVIVGAPSYDHGQYFEGAAFVILGSASGIGDLGPSSPGVAILESDIEASTAFGNAVASAGDVNGDGYADVIVGAGGFDNAQSNEGAAFIFHGGPAGIVAGNLTSAATQLESNQASANFGDSVASAGDVNGDGYADVIVGSPSYRAINPTPGQEEGVAFVYLGRRAGIPSGGPEVAAAELESDQVGGYMGSSVSGAGDVNGDGYADVIVGAMGYDAGQTDEGAAFVYLGSASGISSGNPETAAAQLESDQEDAEMGLSVASAGDVNGDGYADVIVGAGRYSAPEVDEGAAFVFLGSASGIADGTPATASAQLESNQVGASFWIDVAGAGDVNGDGYADVVVGHRLYDNGELNEGAAFVYLGSASGIASGDPTTAAARIESDQVQAHLAINVAGAGDVNGDGYADLIVGGEQYQSGPPGGGSAFVFLGNSLGRPVLARQRTTWGAPVQPWGEALSSTGPTFSAELRANHPDGTGRVKAEFEACPSGVPFGDATCVSEQSASWVPVDGAAPEAAIAHALSGLADDTVYRWRARVLYAPATGPLPASPAHGPWRRPTAQAIEADIRLPEPGGFWHLGTGIAALAALKRRRDRLLLGI